METTRYESMLLPDDLLERRPIHCLACRREVGLIHLLGGETPTKEGSYRLVSLRTDPDRVQRVVGDRHRVRFDCECGATSIYHMVL